MPLPLAKRSLVKINTFSSTSEKKTLFLTSELANKAEIYILAARDTTRAWVPGRGIMGNDVRVYKTMYSTWLSPRLQNQLRSRARLIFPFTVRNVGHQRRSVRLDYRQQRSVIAFGTQTA